MNCEQFKQIIGMRCNEMNAAVEILTPFTFSDGNGIEIFAQSYNSQIHFFDDGFTLLHLHSAGIRLGNNKKRWKPLKGIAEAHGVTLSDDGVFETLCSMESASQGFARIVATLLGVAAWERDQVGVSMDSSWLIDEVAIYLRAWKPDAALIKNPSVKGFSGRALVFDFDLDGQYIDAISPHSASTGAELRKIIDLNSVASHIRKDVLIIVDDRSSPSIAKQEINILGRVAKTWPISSLISASGAGGALQ